MAPTLEQQYARSNRREGFGVRRRNGTTHRGLDFGAAPREQWHAIKAGTVTGRGRSSIVGYWLEVLDGDGMYWTYCHLYAPGVWQLLATRRKIAEAGIVGKVADPNDYHGSAWTGTHMHVAYSATSGGGLMGVVVDPAPKIDAVLRRRAEASNLTAAERTRKIRAAYLNDLAEQHDWKLDGKIARTRAADDGHIDGPYNWLVKRWGKARGRYTGKLTTRNNIRVTSKLGRAMDAEAIARWERKH
jgi:hypothetical protein